MAQAAAILAPASTEEVAAMVAPRRASIACRWSRRAATPAMVGGATPPEDGSALILSLRRMNRLRSIERRSNVAVAEAGMILADLHDRAAEVGRRFPLTLGSRGSCTIGGLVATNAGGTQVLRFGTMRSLVAGVEAVLPDGSIHDGLTALKKDNRGYSLDHLLIGSEGTLGIITAAALQAGPGGRGAGGRLGRGRRSASGARPAAAAAGPERPRRGLRDRPRRLARPGARAYSGHPQPARPASMPGTC